MTTQQQDNTTDYPVQLNIQYPERLHRVTTAFRFILIIPILFILGLLTGGYVSSPQMGHTGYYESSNLSSYLPSSQGIHHNRTALFKTQYSNEIYFNDDQTITYHYFDQTSSPLTTTITSITSVFVSMLFGMTGFLFLAPLLIILFRKKYPTWWFNWNTELIRFQIRVIAYFYLLTDIYPSTENQSHISVDIERPTSEQLARGMPLVKWFLAIPHYVILAILGFINVFVIIAAWFCIIFTGRYPLSLFNYCVGVMRWSLRVTCYAFILTTDQYPPFRLFS